MNRAELLQLDGVGRMTLEARVVKLVRALEAIEVRLTARADNAARLASHPDELVQKGGLIRENAYRVALSDIQTLLEDV
jgi:hypothetical protein